MAKRLARIEGHVKGIRKMIDEELCRHSTANICIDTSHYGSDYKIFTAIVDKYYYEIKHPPGPAFFPTENCRAFAIPQSLAFV
jgi:hypothetical protein